MKKEKEEKEINEDKQVEKKEEVQENIKGEKEEVRKRSTKMGGEEQ